MDGAPDWSSDGPYLMCHRPTRTAAEALAAEIEQADADEGLPISRIEITPDREGGWNVWIWE